MVIPIWGNDMKIDFSALKMIIQGIGWCQWNLKLRGLLGRRKHVIMKFSKVGQISTEVLYSCSLTMVILI